MIELPFTQSDCVAANGEPEALQQYVQALLARQHALDVLETIHQQINEVWGTIRRLLEGTGAVAKANPALRLSRSAQVVEAKNSYRSLERRREVCIAALHQAERRANSALQTILAVSKKASQATGFSTSRHAASRRLVSGSARGKTRPAFSGHC